MLNSRPLYSSSNGDVWSLIHDSESDTILIRHVPNPASGGRISITEVSEFLGQLHGPQHKSLLRMIGIMIDGDPLAV
jgi:hypothetical protein